MRIPTLIHLALNKRINRVMRSRDPDFIVGKPEEPYLLRWFVIPRNRIFNVYAHAFHRSDDDRALHDHPWFNASILLAGEYTEHTIAAGGVHHRRIRVAGDVIVRGPRHAHRIELHAGLCRMLFITGPRLRSWFFHCPDQGLIPWRKFTNPNNAGEVGRGCEQ